MKNKKEKISVEQAIYVGMALIVLFLILGFATGKPSHRFTERIDDEEKQITSGEVYCKDYGEIYGIDCTISLSDSTELKVWKNQLWNEFIDDCKQNYDEHSCAQEIMEKALGYEIKNGIYKYVWINNNLMKFWIE